MTNPRTFRVSCPRHAFYICVGGIYVCVGRGGATGREQCSIIMCVVVILLCFVYSWCNAILIKFYHFFLYKDDLSNYILRDCLFFSLSLTVCIACLLKGTRWTSFFSSKKDSFYTILKIKTVSAGIQPPIHGLLVELWG